MYRVFNMGIGMVVFSDPSRTADLLNAMPSAMVIGEVTAEPGRKVYLTPEVE
jgi:phosphoribosylaminoimidazole (AIR) synthetase